MNLPFLIDVGTALALGLRVVEREPGVVMVCLACVAFGFLALVALTDATKSGLSDAAQLFSLAVAGWVVPSLIVGVLVLLLRASSIAVGPAIWIVGALSMLAVAWSTISVWRRPPMPGALLAGFLLALSLVLLLLRLAFVEPLALPSYFDSIEHYRIIQALVASAEAGGPFAWPTEGYYHLGYHAILSALVVLSRVQIAPLMLVAGQVALAFLPAALYFIASRQADSATAGVVAVLFGAFGWYMPAFVSNWGKYPALVALPAMLFALGLLHLWRPSSEMPANRALLFLAGLGALAASLVHTRALVLIAIAIGSWVTASWLTRRSSGFRLGLDGALLLILFAEVVGVLRSTQLSPVLDPYLGRGLPITLLAGAFIVAALWCSSRLAFASMLAAAAMLAALFVPLPAGFSTTVLDRPLVEAALFAPLALGASSGLIQLLDLIGLATRQWKAVGAAILGLLLLLHSFSSYSLAPSRCCVLADDEDMVAMNWIIEKSPAAARFGVAAQSAAFLPPGLAPLQASSDGGGWITVLTGRETVPFPAETDVTAPRMYANLCASGVDYLYVGTGVAHFDATGLAARPDWYLLQLHLPRVQIFELVGCPP